MKNSRYTIEEKKITSYLVFLNLILLSMTLRRRSEENRREENRTQSLKNLGTLQDSRAVVNTVNLLQ